MSVAPKGEILRDVLFHLEGGRPKGERFL